MSQLLNDIGNFSFERMDEMAREIVYLKHRVKCLEDYHREDGISINRLEYQVIENKKHSNERINDLERRLNGLEKGVRENENDRRADKILSSSHKAKP